jgi:hypothetical protein
VISNDTGCCLAGIPERQFVLPVRDPLRRDRLQHLQLSVGVGRSKMLDVT